MLAIQRNHNGTTLVLQASAARQEARLLPSRRGTQTEMRLAETPLAGSALIRERTRPRVQGSVPSLNPLTDVSDEGVADGTRGRVLSPKKLTGASLFLKLRHCPLAVVVLMWCEYGS
jgi:hypothetical protein